MTSKSTFSPKESKSRILRGYCGGQSINRPIKVKIIGSVAHPRMQIRLRRPRTGHKGNHRGEVVNITKVEFRTCPRTPYSSAPSCYNRTSKLCHHWRWDNRPRVRKKRQTNIYNYSYLRINCLSTNSLAVLMWRWYLNSNEAALQLPIGSSRRR